MVKATFKLAAVVAGSWMGAALLEATQSWLLFAAALPVFWAVGYVAGSLIEGRVNSMRAKRILLLGASLWMAAPLVVDLWPLAIFIDHLVVVALAVHYLAGDGLMPAAEQPAR